MKALTGTYLHLQRLSTEDGPGIRTTVFMKGCKLRCQWCHNPESLLYAPQIQRVETNCIQCGSCMQACARGCIRTGGDCVSIDQSSCDACGICVEACPTGALELLGKAIHVDDLYRELIKDESYFQTSKGGITLSGGEPALQADFCAALMERLQDRGIHTALDTCGMTSQKSLEKILPYADMVLYDLKEIDPDKHRTFTGQSNEVIIENLLAVRDFIREMGPAMKLWIRTPLIPGATASRENLLGIGSLLGEHLTDVVERWELCAFNNLCRDKYARLGMEWAYESTALLTKEKHSELENWAKESGFPAELILATGATQVLV